VNELERAMERVRTALDLVRALDVIEGTDRDDIERLLENAMQNLLDAKRSLSNP
jgi:uncharacterized protein YutE (UPF0331/DUF86 family)